jgi:hypothetical protein
MITAHAALALIMKHLLSTWLLILLAAVLASGCAGTGEAPPRGLDRGILHLRAPLEIPPGAATARLQYGRVVASNAVQEHDPFCVFELDTVSPQAQTVSPGRFRITAIGHSVETIAGMPAPRPVLLSFDDDGSPSHLYFKTIFRLRDDALPVRALTCMSNQMAPGIAPFMRHLSLEEIRGALGDLFTLELGVPGARL